MNETIRTITAARVIDWDGEIFGIAFILGQRHVAVPIGQKREAETIAQTAVGKSDALIRDLEGKAEARFG